MPREYPRALRVNVQLQREIADLIRTELTDPRVAAVTVTRVKVSPDLRNASVFVSVLDDDAALASALKALNGASQYLRHELAQRLRLRLTPTLRFSADVALREGDRVAGLIRNAVGEDRSHHLADPGLAAADDGSREVDPQA